MARNYRIVFDKKGFAKLRNSERMKAELNKRIDRIQAYAGDGFEKVPAYEGWKGRAPRARARVFTYSGEAIQRQKRDNVLQTALSHG